MEDPIQLHSHVWRLEWMTKDEDCQPEHLRMASPCGLACSQHGDLRVVGCLPWAPNKNIPVNKKETAWPFRIYPQNLPASLLPTLLVKTVANLLRVKGKAMRYPLLMGKTSEPHFTRAWGMRDTVVVSSGKYHLPLSLSVQGAELPCQPQPTSLEFEWEIHFWLVSALLFLVFIAQSQTLC